MLDWVLKKLGGTSNEREVKKVRPIVERVNALEPEMKLMADPDFKLRTARYRQEIDNGRSLDDLLPEVFAMVREAGRRVLNMRHFDVQIIGGTVLHQGRIAEMRTGEGKTLVATLPIVLNALEGKGVHLVTVNDYLAKRDAEWMGMIYGFVGLTTGVIVHAQNDRAKKAAYRADITYGQNNEFGFDYLRDNMKFSIYDYCQRPLHYAVVDEVDSILIDEARTPLIISGMAEESTDKYRSVDLIIPSLRKDEHFTLDEKGHSAMLTEEGIELCQRKLGISNLYDPANIETLHVLQQALKAHTLYKRDVNYMVSEDGRVLIIDEHTGRVLPGRRWSDGLHQAVEAKEKVRVQEETRTLATITFQNLFRLYDKLSGMTGTAATEAEEFHKTYKLECVTIPTNKPMIRKDAEDVVYKTEKEKFRALIEEVGDCVQRGQPVLVGTASVEKNEAISTLLTRRGIKHEVLNAKQHEREAYVVAQAGRKSSVTVATNMAGRGTDIVLGGNPEMLAKRELLDQEDPDGKLLEAAMVRAKALAEKEKEEVLAAGGLHILGSERHEARRIDNQLRGRGGRQGDPGSSRFYLSLEDDLMRIFAADRISRLMDRMGMEENVPIEHRWVTKAVENAQKKVEARNFDIRKNLLEYDDVMNMQRKSIYALRKNILEGRYSMQTEPVEGGKKSERAPRKVPDLPPPVVEHIRGVIESMVRHYGVVREGVELSPPYRDDDSAKPLPTLEQVAGIAHEKVEREVYEYFGVPAELEDVRQDAKAALAMLVADVPKALAEQRERLLDLSDQTIGDLIERFCPAKLPPDDWDVAGLEAGMQEAFNLSFAGLGKVGNREHMAERAYSDVEKFIAKKEQEIGPELLLRVFRILYLEEIDKQWIDHLQAMDSLRDGIGLRGYGQRDPKLEYKKEGYDMFAEMMQNIQTNVLSKVFRVQVQTQADAQRLVPQRRARRTVEGRGAGPAPVGAPAGDAPAQQGGSATQRAMRQASQPAPQKIETVRRETPKVGRNDPCPCGSGKKYKKCHGQAAGGGEAA